MIADHHLKMLAESGVTPEHAALRGYMTCGPAQHSFLQHVNVVKPGRRIPGLLVPLLRADGSTWGHQYRPDDPRLRDGRPVKYETPYGQPNGLDIPPGVGDKLGDPGVPLWITEGTKKADCGAIQGLCIVGLTGVWNWMGTGSAGSKMALPEFRDIPLNGRRVILAFDGDVARKPAVQKALHALAQYLSYKGARVEYLWLPDTDDKTGLDDYLVTNGHTVDDVWRLVKPTAPPLRVKSDKGTAGDRQPRPKSEGGASGARRASDPVNGAELLDDVKRWFGRFIRVTDPDDLNLLALWTVHTYLVIELYTTPRLRVDSVIFGSGKTTVLDHLYRLCQNPVQAASLSSPALIPRMLETQMRTILLDEIDRSLRPDKPGVEDLLAILNSGYRFGATRPVLVPTKGGGWETKDMPTYAAIGMAGNSPNLPSDTISRELRILLMPDLDGTVEDSDWEMIGDEAERLRSRIGAWAGSVRESVKGSVVDLPPKCIGRSKEKWRPLKRVAVAAGGDWPAIVDRLTVKNIAEDEAEREAGLKAQPPGMVMLADLHAVWPASEGFMPTRELVNKLIIQNPAYWGSESGYGKPLTETRLGRLVTQAAKVTSIRRSGEPPRGYLRSQLQPVWRRLGIAPPDQPDEPDEPGEPGGNEPDERDADGRDGSTARFAGFAKSVGLKVTPNEPDGSAAYRKGLCRDCGVKSHSAGRPRCDECHRIYLNVNAGYR
jgi:hypothetical protein